MFQASPRANDDDSSDVSLQRNVSEDRKSDLCDSHDDAKSEVSDTQKILDSDSSEFIEGYNESECEDTLTEDTKIPTFTHKLYPGSIPRVESDPMISSMSTISCEDHRSVLDSQQHSEELKVSETPEGSSPRRLCEQLNEQLGGKLDTSGSRMNCIK